jgi:PhnB protein
MDLNPYLQFTGGQCDAAFKFYEQCLGGKILFRITAGESPMATCIPPERRDEVIHIRLQVGDKILMGCDAPPEVYQKPQGFTVTLGLKEPAEAERIFDTLAENGNIRMPLQETFWAQKFGMLTDQFGTPWMINCEKDPNG